MKGVSSASGFTSPILLRQRMIGISLPYCSEVFGWLGLVPPSLAESVTPSHGCTPVLGTLLGTHSVNQTDIKKEPSRYLGVLFAIRASRWSLTIHNLVQEA